MALNPDLLPFKIAGTLDSPHTLDVFLDYVCPFSKIMFETIDRVVKPLADEGGPYYGKIKVIFRPQIQPFHSASTFTTEAGIAVAMASPDNFYKFSSALFEVQSQFYDKPLLHMTPVDVRKGLATVAAGAMPAKDVKAFVKLLTLDVIEGAGLGVSQNLLYTLRFSRQNSINYSPTVLWDGIIRSEITSSWGDDEWVAFLLSNVIV